jgi:hypothetical protein
MPDSGSCVWVIDDIHDHTVNLCIVHRLVALFFVPCRTIKR